MSSSRFTLQLADLDVQVLAFEAEEAIGRPYRIELELVSGQPDLDLPALLRQPAWLALDEARGMHGLVWRIEQTQCSHPISHYRLELRPALAWLEQRRNCRIFEQLSVPQILQKLLAEHGILGDTCRFVLSGDYPPRDYCVQYAESDLHFLQRLCEEEGLHYHFLHAPEQGHVLVFGDDQSAFPRLAAEQLYRPDSGQPQERPVISHFAESLRSCSDTMTLHDHDAQQPRLSLHGSAWSGESPTPSTELYDYPGRFTDRNRGKQLARRALEAVRREQRRAEGRSSQPLLAGGQFIELRGHPRADCNQLWLLSEVHHQGYQPQVLEAFADLPAESAERQPRYRNRFIATPWDSPYRLGPEHAKPRLFGSQSAVVSGPEGEEIHCDAQGRVQVRFHWERESRDPAHSQAWLRVASGWAGDQYGALLIPRVGMEVLVSFLDGDPDRPLVTGCLYHREHEPPHALPEHATRSVLRTRSSPNGHGANELCIDDRQGAEQIHVHAQRDWDQQVNHDFRLRVGNDQHLRVTGNSHCELQGEDHQITHGNRLVELKADDHLTLGGSQHLKLGAGQFVEAGREIHLSSSQKVVMEAGSELTLKVGGSFIKLDASGVTVVGAQVKLNSGGNAGVGSGARPILPQTPGRIDAPPAAGTLHTPQHSAGHNSTVTQTEPNAEQAHQSQALIVDIWGDPALGSQLQLLDPKEEA